GLLRSVFADAGLVDGALGALPAIAPATAAEQLLVGRGDYRRDADLCGVLYQPSADRPQLRRGQQLVSLAAVVCAAMDLGAVASRGPLWIDSLGTCSG